MFRFLQEKDMFEKYFKQHLSKRLLGDRSQSEDMERKVSNIYIYIMYIIYIIYYIYII